MSLSRPFAVSRSLGFVGRRGALISRRLGVTRSSFDSCAWNVQPLALRSSSKLFSTLTQLTRTTSPPPSLALSASSTGFEFPQLSTHPSHLTIHWSPTSVTSPQSNFDYIWLRDHCRCPHCFHPITKQRMVDTWAIPRDVKPTGCHVAREGLSLDWKESGQIHTSTFPWEWLQDQTYDPKKPKPQTQNPKKLWSSSIASNPPTAEFGEVMNDDKALYAWLKNIDTYGFSFVSNVPPTVEDTEALTRKIGFIRETQYGGFWDFSSDLAHGDTAYTSIALGPHTDNTYFTDPSCLQLFHLIQPAPKGGHTLLIDGFHIANTLRTTHPHYFRTLSTVNVPAHAAGDEGCFYDSGVGKPVIELGGEGGGEVKSVRWNNDDRSVMTSFGKGSAKEWYEAARTWNALLNNPKSEFWIPLKAGTAVVINNHRVLHGRSEFTGPRRMCGAYIGGDEYRSRLHVLKERFEPSRRNRILGESRTRSVWSPGL